MIKAFGAKLKTTKNNVKNQFFNIFVIQRDFYVLQYLHAIYQRISWSDFTQKILFWFRTLNQVKKYSELFFSLWNIFDFLDNEVFLIILFIFESFDPNLSCQILG